MGKNRRDGPKIFVANLRDFSPKKNKFWDSFEKRSEHFSTNIWTFKVLKRFYKIWVGSTVFTVPVLCNAKYPKMHEAANNTLFKF
jgi:hypothetical protein